MRIRWKLLILLLTISLVPLGIAIWIGQDAGRSLGNDLAAEVRASLQDDAQRILLQTVHDQSKLLVRAGALTEHNLRIQAREVERCLAAPVPAAAELHFVEEFESDDELPGLLTSDKHARSAADGARIPMRISLEHQNYILAPGVARAAVADELVRLSVMPATYRLIYESQANLIHWQFTTLTSGVHCSYPGHGHYPPGYDPRARLWYRNAMENGTLTWNPPTVDAPTRQVILNASMPVRWPDGSFAGVTGIDIRITDLLGSVELPAEWARTAETMIVIPRIDDRKNRRVIHIMAHQDYTTGTQWEVPLEIRELVSPDAERIDEFFDDLLDERSSVRYMPYNGRETLWAYSALERAGSALLVVVPCEDVLWRAQAAEAQVHQRMSAHQALMIAVVTGVILVVFVLSVLVSRQFTRPIQELAAAARRIAAGDLETSTNITSRDELGQLGTTVNQMLPQLRESLRLKQSLTLAMEVQQSLLPEESPEVEGLDIAGCSIYCDETGGDYYDFVELSALNKCCLGVAVGDVTGHGIAAALLMATARALLRGRAGELGHLGKLLSHINRHLSADVPSDKFMSLCYLLVDGQARNVRWANAGHDPIVVYRTASDSFDELGGNDLVLGISPDWHYKEYGPAPIAPNDILVIGTDGIWEARDNARDMFGKERMYAIIRQKQTESAHDISTGITDAVAAFRGTFAQTDDITLVVIKVVEPVERIQQ
ncbi:MAG: SpoIIE family protein phosphatase [Planctomycetota bacterium]